MKYEEWCERHEQILAEADEYNKWADKAKDKLLCKYGPRISALGHKMYMGCGFHYSLEQQFGKLVTHLALPWQPSANHCAKIEDDWSNSIVMKVLYEGLVRDIIRAEHSAKKIASFGYLLLNVKSYTTAVPTKL